MKQVESGFALEYQGHYLEGILTWRVDYAVPALNDVPASPAGPDQLQSVEITEIDGGNAEGDSRAPQLARDLFEDIDAGEVSL